MKSRVHAQRLVKDDKDRNGEDEIHKRVSYFTWKRGSMIIFNDSNNRLCGIIGFALPKIVFLSKKNQFKETEEITVISDGAMLLFLFKSI